MKFRSCYENLRVIAGGKTILFENGAYSTENGEEIALLSKNPNVRRVSIGIETGRGRKGAALFEPAAKRGRDGKSKTGE